MAALNQSLSVPNNSAYYGYGRCWNKAMDDGVIAQGSVQATAYRIRRSTRVIGGATNAGIILPSILSCEAVEPILVINDGANTLKVYPASGEQIASGGANVALSVATADCVMLFPDFNGQGGTLNWSGAVISA